MPVEILHLLGTAKNEGAGIARIAAALAAGLDRKRYRVHAWFLGEDGPLVARLEQAGAQVRVLRWHRGARDPIGALRFWRGLLGADFAIVHQHHGGRSVSGLVRAATRAALVIHVHGRIVESQGSAVISVRVPKADAVIAASRAVAQQVCNAQARVIYAGIEIPETSRSGSGTGRVLGVAGRLAPVKGIAYLIRALVWLRQEFPDVRLEIAGDGPQRPALESEAVTLGLTGAISFLGWREDLPSLFSRWDVFVQPSLEEAFPVVTLEAMAAGLPVVATNAGGLPELVQDAETGLLVPPEDPPALADALRKLLADPVLRRAMGRAGHVRVRERFSVHRMTDEITQVYEDILRSRAC